MNDRRRKANREPDMRRQADPTTADEAISTEPQPRAPGADVVVEFTRRDLAAVIAVALAFALTPWVLGDPDFIRPSPSGTKKSTPSAQGQVVHVCGALPSALPRQAPRKRCVL